MLCSCLLAFFFSCSPDLHDLHSFPTRRSSDLTERGAFHLGQDDLDREDRRLLLLVRLEPDLLEPSLHGRVGERADLDRDRKSTRLNSSHRCISYAVFCLKKKKNNKHHYISSRI